MSRKCFYLPRYENTYRTYRLCRCHHLFSSLPFTQYLMKQFTISTLAFFAIIATLAKLEATPVPDLMTPLVTAFETLETLFK